MFFIKRSDICQIKSLPQSNLKMFPFEMSLNFNHENLQ